MDLGPNGFQVGYPVGLPRGLSFFKNETGRQRVLDYFKPGSEIGIVQGYISRCSSQWFSGNLYVICCFRF